MHDQQQDANVQGETFGSSSEERLTELEIKFAYQQEMIESLSGEVSKQWAVIDRLTRQLGMMQEQIAAAVQDADSPADELPPPHY